MNSEAVTNRPITSVITSAVLVLGLCTFPARPALAEDAAIITGYTVSQEAPPEMPFTDSELAALGQVSDIGLSMALHHLGIDPGTAEFNDITAAVDEFFAGASPQDSGIERESFVAMYQPCMMRMVTPTHSMAIRMPPGSAQAHMEAWDRNSMEGVAIELNRDLQATAQATGSGWNSGVTMTPRGGSDTLIGHDVREYAFTSSGGLGNLGGPASSPQQTGSQAGPAGIASMVSVENSGTAWVADDVTGIDIIRRFYRNFAGQVAAAQGDDSFYGGMMKNMVGMLQHGLPLHIRQTVQSKVAGQTMMSGTSESWVTGASLISRPAGECSSSTIPDGYQITQIDAGAMAGAGTGSGAAGASGATGGTAGSAGNAAGFAQPCDCSCAAFQRLQEMGENRQGKKDGSPEDQAMAMCMMQCMQQFMSCAMQGNR